MWSCGVMLYVMLSAQYPFGRPEDTNLKLARQMHNMLQVSSICLHRASIILHLSFQLPAVIPNFGWMEQLFLSGMLGTSIPWSKDPCRRIHYCF